MYNLHQTSESDERVLRRALTLRALNRQKRIVQLEALLRKVRAALALDPAVWEAELINEIDEVLK